MKSFIWHIGLIVILATIIIVICSWLQIDSDLKNYILGIMVGYVSCRVTYREQIEACNKLILEIKEIVPKLK